ncbi:hypothetical protein Tco_1036964 [Tanacetum coccineum]
MEVNSDDMVIKSDSEEEMLADIEEILGRLRAINLKLDPRKCSFRVEEGIYFGHLITKQGIRAYPSKVKAISALQLPKMVSEIQSFGKKLAALNKFLSKSTEKALPFMKTLKSYTSGKMVHVPRSLEKERKCSINGRKEEEIGSRIFCKSDTTRSRTKVPRVGKAHTCPRVCRKEALKIFPTAPNTREEIKFKGRNLIKGQILADFLAETSSTEREEEKNGEAKRKEPKPKPENTWKLFTDGASSFDGLGAGLMLVNPKGKEYTYA